jgi:hypothetical protein
VRPSNGKEEKELKRNITIALEENLLKKAKLVAAKKDVSVSRLVTDQLSKIIMEEDQYEASKRRAVARLKKGFHLGGRILATREELHERR